MKNLKEESKPWNWLTSYGHIWLPLLALATLSLLSFVRWEWPNSIINSFTLSHLSIGVLGLLGIFLATWHSLVGIKNKKIAERNSTKDAFTNAIQQLGSGSRQKPNIEVRLGAIYTLEKLSQENKELYQTIIDILANYVRENAPIPPHFEKAPSDSTRIDVQTAMTVLGRRKTRPTDPALNLHRVYLPQVNLGRANLQNADLMGADLRGANLTLAKLQCASLFNVNLLDANLIGANIQGCDLTAAKGLSSEQLKMARNWKSTYRDQELSSGADIPDFFEKYGPMADTV